MSKQLVRNEDSLQQVEFAYSSDCVGVVHLRGFSRLMEVRKRRNKLQACLQFGSKAEALPRRVLFRGCYEPLPAWLPTAEGLFLVSGMRILMDVVMVSI